VGTFQGRTEGRSCLTEAAFFCATEQ